MKDSGKIILAALAGAAVGTVLGILFAPAKGSETRRQMMDAADDLAETLKDKVKESSDVINDLKERIFPGETAHADNGNGDGYSQGRGQSRN